MNSTFLSKYTLINKIGEGSFSEVLRCEDLTTGTYYAAKRLKKVFKSPHEVANCAEIIAMHKLPKHPNMVYMLEFHFDPSSGRLIFIFELMDMSMYDYMKLKRRRIPETKVRNYLYQILQGLNHLHSHGLFHRDIKPENILVHIPSISENNCPPYQYQQGEIIKIADFGSIRGIFSKPPYTEYISTRWYRSPECLLSVGYYGPKMDVWATGCVFYEMLTLKPLFPGHDEIDQLARIHDVLGTPTERMLRKLKKKSHNCINFPKKVGYGLKALGSKLSEDAIVVLQLMVQYDPETRTNVRRLLDHKYFKTLRDEDSLKKIKMSKEELLGPLNKTIGDFNSVYEFIADNRSNKYKTNSTCSSTHSVKKKPEQRSKTQVDIAHYKTDYKPNHNLLANQAHIANPKLIKSWGVDPNMLKPKYPTIKKQVPSSTINNHLKISPLKASNQMIFHKNSKEKSNKTTSYLPQLNPNFIIDRGVKTKLQSRSFCLPGADVKCEKNNDNIDLPSMHKPNQLLRSKKILNIK